MICDGIVIQHLNWVLSNELTAINQYFPHATMFRHWGSSKLNDREYKESIDEARHADRLIERTPFFDGLPNLQQLHELLIGENATEALKCDLKLEEASNMVLKEAIAHCEKACDDGSRELFETILDSEEEHIDGLETRFGLIDKVGLENYRQSWM